MSATNYIGSSGFSFRDWKGIFYPPELPPRKWFAYYCSQFNTLELNVTFYQMPLLKSFEMWYDQSPTDFRFAVKAPRQVTHYKKINPEAQPILADFYGTVREGLREKLGPVHFQLPSKAAYTDELAQRLIESLDPSFTNVAEFRHPSWWEADPQRLLARHNIAFVVQSYPPLLELPDEVVANTAVLYYRFHGVPELYKSAYHPEFLANIAKQVKAAGQVRQAYLCFNNGIGGVGTHDARQVQALLGR
jgi:uncharacterized protein YecE (DUF72 family)